MTRIMANLKGSGEGYVVLIFDTRIAPCLWPITVVTVVGGVITPRSSDQPRFVFVHFPHPAKPIHEDVLQK